MRKTLALGCCALSLVFGFVAGAGHVHESADHHEEMRGLHLDHTHLGDAADHEAAGHHGHAIPEKGDVRSEARHAAHHDGDARYLTASALRSLDPGLRVMPATIATGTTIERPALSAVLGDESAEPLRGPPGAGPTSTESASRLTLHPRAVRRAVFRP